MKLRIISGKHRGKKFDYPDTSITRPTKDRVKEAVFSMMQPYLRGAVVLDLFGGSGALSFEAVSRGAMKSILIEKNSIPMKVIKSNILQMDIKNVEPINIDCLKYLEKSDGLKFDLILFDPPFKDYNVLNKALNLCAEKQLLQNLGHILIETDDDTKIKIPSKYIEIKRKKYGRSIILLISNNI